MIIKIDELSRLISDAKEYIKLRNYFQAAATYEKVAKNLFKIDTKKAIEFFNLAIKYYLKSAISFHNIAKYEQSAKCYENLGKLYEKWLKNPNIALDYFMTATKYRMRSIKDNIEYQN